MASVVFRKEKRKGVEANRIMAHNLRLTTPKNADPARSHLNVIDYRLEDWRERVEKARTRRDNAEYVEWVLGSDREFMGSLSPERRSSFRKHATDWVEGVFGEGSVILSAEHNDEDSPHLHVAALPIHEGELNAKHFIGGGNKRMSQLQTDFVAYMNAHGFPELVRGVEGSKATHMETAKWRAEMKKAHEVVASRNKNMGRELDRILEVREGKGKMFRSTESLDEYQERVLVEIVQLIRDTTLAVELSKCRGAWSEYERDRERLQAAEKELAELRPLAAENARLSQLVEEFKVANERIRSERDEAAKSRDDMSWQLKQAEADNALLKAKVKEYLPYTPEGKTRQAEEERRLVARMVGFTEELKVVEQDMAKEKVVNGFTVIQGGVRR